MNIQHRLNMAGAGLLAMLEPAKHFVPTDGYEEAHDLGRWWDAVLRLEETIGLVIPAELEAAALRNLQLMTDNPDRLLMNRPDVEWLKHKAQINPHNFRETLLAYGGLIRRRQSMWARDSALQLVGTMDRIFRADGHLHCEDLAAWGQLPCTDDPSHTEPERNGWFDATATSGRSLEALVWLYELTHEPMVLDVAGRIAAHHLAHSINRDGTPRGEIEDPENVGHDHSYHGTLRGLLLFGLQTGRKEYVTAVEATYRKTVRHRIVKESGWAAHDLGKMRFSNTDGDPVADPASAGDSAQLALWLALRAGCDDLLDDVERLVRARLLPAQLTESDMRENPVRVYQPREMGAWAIHAASHAGKGCTPDVHAAVVHSLCDIHRNVVTQTSAGIRVNLHFDTETAPISVTSIRGERATVTVDVRCPDNVMIRVPGWAPEGSIRVSVDGKAAPLHRAGAFAFVPVHMLKCGSRIALSFDLPERRTTETMPSGRCYEFAWRGDDILGVTPGEMPLPFYPTLQGHT